MMLVCAVKNDNLARLINAIGKFNPSKDKNLCGGYVFHSFRDMDTFIAEVEYYVKNLSLGNYKGITVEYVNFVRTVSYFSPDFENQGYAVFYIELV